MYTLMMEMCMRLVGHVYKDDGDARVDEHDGDDDEKGLTIMVIMLMLILMMSRAMASDTTSVG